MSSVSSLTVVRFVPAHFERLELQPSQIYLRGHTDDVKLRELAEGGPAVTIFSGEQVLLCGGLREFGPNRGVLWSFVDRRAGGHFIAVHRVVTRFVETVERPHIQATCRSGFAAGARWLRMLGFEWSLPLGPYGPAGVPHELFERVY